jgi:starch synthase (maltosyl-transferring)
MTSTLIETGRRRVLIENVDPEIDAGEFPIQRTVGRCVVVSADALTDGHDRLSCVLKYRKEEESAWNEVAMEPIGNDRWQAEFRVTETGRYRYTVEAWVDRFQSWREDLKKRVDAGLVVAVELQMGAKLVRGAAQSAAGPDAEQLRAWADSLEREPAEEAVALALSDRLAQQMAAHGDRRLSTVYARELAVVVDRPKAGFSTWYEMFPRSCSPEPGRHGTFRDCEDRLPDIARMGFDVLYLPPIHPIGRTNRKGKNAAPGALPDDPGSPWAIGAAEGGHKAVHPQLGSLADFDRLVSKAREQGIEVALDLAYQCSPDHPYVGEHPDWFRHRPDGSVQYAENPPKKYEDIYPFDFETEAWRELWEELKDVALFWVRRGVRIFRVDNPHTKPFPFWRWLIGEIKAEYPDVLFLAEAFTRPKVMYDLAKLGFTQSYTYFTWRNTKEQLVRYVSELMETEVREYFRPNLWPNTPDILAEYLQYGGRAAFIVRLVLAGTLAANYGIYGPAFELMENRAREPGSEEYLDSEKCQIRHWDLDRPDSLKEFIRRVNQVRRDNPALQRDGNLRFHSAENEQLLCYSRISEEERNAVLVVVNLDPCHMQSGWVELPVRELGIEPDQPYQVHDLLGGARYLWDGPRNFVQLDPATVPAHIFLLRRRVRTERQFDYFM